MLEARKTAVALEEEELVCPGQVLIKAEVTQLIINALDKEERAKGV